MGNSPTIGSLFTAERNHVFAVDAVGTRDSDHVIGRSLFFHREGLSTGKAYHDIRFFQCGVDRNALVKHETIAVPMRAAHFFEIAKNTALELPDVRKTGLQHDGACLFASYSTRAEHYDRLVFHAVG